MNECGKFKKYFEKAINGELSKAEENIFNDHLKACGSCLSELEELKNTLLLLKSNTLRETNDEFMNNFWETLKPKLEKRKSFFQQLRDSYTCILDFGSNWKYQLASAVTLLVVGIFIGKYFLVEKENASQSSIAQNNNAAIRQTAINAEAAEYFDRSKVLLIGLMNFDPATDDVETISLPHQKKISRELLTKAYDLKTELNKPGQQQLKKLVTDIELILLQIANLETRNNLDGIELIKDGVNNRGIILKINIQEIKESGSTKPPEQQTQNESKRI